MEKTLSLLEKDNIRLNCEAKSKEEIIREIGGILLDSGYIESEYIDGMLAREKVFSTNIGNEIAIPHSVEEGKKYVKTSGIAVMIFPSGTEWNGEIVRLVIAIAGKGNEHLDILSNVAETLCTPEAITDLMKSDVDGVYNIFSGDAN